MKQRDGEFALIREDSEWPPLDSIGFNRRPLCIRGKIVGFRGDSPLEPPPYFRGSKKGAQHSDAFRPRALCPFEQDVTPFILTSTFWCTVDEA